MKRIENMPSLVYWGLWGIRTRSVAIGFTVTSVVLAAIIIPAAIHFNDYRYLFFALVPVWYWYAIKWVDKNASWPEKSNS